MDIAPPKPPALTDKQMDKNNEEQAILAKKFSAPASKTLLRAKAVINDFSGIPEQDLSLRQKSQLTDAYSQAGEFQRAYDLSGDDTFLAIINADDKECDCKDFTTHILENGQPKKVTYSRFFKRRDLVRDGKRLDLMVCNNCGHIKFS